MKDKRAIARAKRGFGVTAVNRTISDAAVAPKSVSADSRPNDKRLSVTEAAPGIPSFNLGGFRAFAPGPAANRDHGTPFGAATQDVYDFWSHGLPAGKR